MQHHSQQPPQYYDDGNNQMVGVYHDAPPYSADMQANRYELIRQFNQINSYDKNVSNYVIIAIVKYENIDTNEVEFNESYSAVYCLGLKRNIFCRLKLNCDSF